MVTVQTANETMRARVEYRREANITTWTNDNA